MPDLNFCVTGVKPSTSAITPALQFTVRLTNATKEEPIQALLLNVQIQIQPARRNYTSKEQEKLIELFGPPELWGQTLRNRLWAQCSMTVGAFRDERDAIVQVPCTYDLKIAATKYFCALEDGEVSLLFLFNGSVFYAGPEGRLQVSPVSWNKECEYQMPSHTWHDLMDAHYPDTTWLALQRDVFERLCAYKRAVAMPTWESTIEHLLGSAKEPVPITVVDSISKPGDPVEAVV